MVDRRARKFQHRVLRDLALIFTALLCLSLLSPPLPAQENDECLMCHDDSDLTGFHGEVEFPVYVDPKLFGDSAHADMDCVDCHIDLIGIDMEHDEDVEPVDCSMCHDQQAEQHALSLHGQAAARGDELAPSCSDCHTSHHILSHLDPQSPTNNINIPFLCGKCHSEGAPVARNRDIPQDHILANYSMSIHGEGIFKKGLTVTAVCTSCHTSHMILPHTDRRSSIFPDNVSDTCTQCHARIEEVHRKFIEGELWEKEPHKIPVCVDCHSPHKIRRVFYQAGAANKDCLRCHADENLAMEKDGETVSLFVDEAAYNAGKHSGTACAQCHTEVSTSLERPCEPVRSLVDCSICHADQVLQHSNSIHGHLAALGDTDAPTCLDCHDRHATMDHKLPSSPTYARNVPDLCARCHRDGEVAANRIAPDHPEHIVGSYNMSIHGKGLIESGLVVTATCINCHTAHGPLPSRDPASTVHPDNIAHTCGTCHHGIEETFQGSIHWPENVDTDKELPTCEDCHTSHTISRTDGTDFRMLMMNQCGRCHVDETNTFFDTFHGKVSRLGDSGAAKCYDCHGTHNILPITNTESTLSRENIVDTCGECHPGAHRRFAGYLTHATHHDPEKYPFLFWAFWGMTTLLVGTLSFAMIHTLAWLFRLWRSREEWRKIRELHKPGTQFYKRFTTGQRINHLVMLLSFFTLALTGMALKFSYMGWAQAISDTLGGFETMGTLHRIGAVALIVIFIFHLMNVWTKRKEMGISWLKFITGPYSMLFTKTDLTEFIASIKWFLGIGPRPRYGRYTYWEKFDYFAVFWGVFIIGSTGFVLWFPEFFTRLLPGWSVNVATIIHSDEALLAVAFIFTVHFFNTHFRPDKFPMDPVIFTGRVTLDELKHDKPREYEQAVADGTLESRMAHPYPRRAERLFRIFGFCALAIGLTLIALITYSMLFGYR